MPSRPPAPRWNADSIASLPAETRKAILTGLSGEEAIRLLHDWRFWARASQLPPAGRWRIWLILAGRGFGKTRAGAEWVRARVEAGRAKRIALVGETLADARQVMVEGESGLLAISPPWNRPLWQPSLRRLAWPNGAVATAFSADDPEQLRGPQFDAAWADELAKWRHPAAWDNLMFALRLGADPRCVATTTPRPRPWLRPILTDPATIVTRGSTRDNEANLAPGFASRVYRGYEAERASYGLGDTVNVPVPSSFAAQDHAPGSGSTAQDIDAGTVPIRLDRHKEVKFAVSDRDLAYASERIIDDHLRPAAYALADSIDQDLCALYRFVPWAVDVTGSAGAGWVTTPRRRLRELLVPVDDGNLHLMVDPAIEQDFLGLDIFHAALVTGGTANQDALLRGSLGTRFGAEIFVNQNVRPHASGTLISAGSDTDGVLDGAVARGASGIAVGGFASGATVKEGDSFVIEGHAQRYVVTEDATLAGGAGNLSIHPAAAADYANGAILSFENGTGSAAGSFSANLMFHRNFAALVLAPLPATGDGRGAQIESVTDPVTGLSLRARMWYDGDTATNYVALDVLYGLTVLDGNLAVRVRRPLVYAEGRPLILLGVEEDYESDRITLQAWG